MHHLVAWSSSRWVLALAALALPLHACSPSPSSRSGPPDATLAAVDASSTGADAAFDAGPDDDPGTVDVGTVDAGTVDAGNPVTAAHAVTGLCVFLQTTHRELSSCSGIDELSTCAYERCGSAECDVACKGYTDCLAASALACDPACQPDEACGSCIVNRHACVFLKDCSLRLECGQQESGGWCDQLRSCCLKQGEHTDACHQTAEVHASLGGDPECRSAMSDPALVRALPVSCDFMPFGEPIGLPTWETRAMLFSATEGFRHASIEAARTALTEHSLTSGVVALWTEQAETLVQALPTTDVVVFLNTSGDVLDEAQQQAIEQFIRAGGGFVGVHSAADTEYGWPFYAELVGARFADHPAVQEASVRVVQPAHATVEHLPETSTRSDEWYNFQSDPADVAEVVLTLDESSYEGGTMGAQHPLAWFREVDEGRAYFTALGHEKEAWSDEALLEHVTRAIHWASGRETESETQP